MDSDLRTRLREEPLSTVTHARIRAGQGDVRGAIDVLRSILKRNPGDGEALLLMEEYEGASGTEYLEEVEESLEPVEGADAGDLAQSFREALGGAVTETGRRIRRLRALLERISRMRSDGSA